MNTNSGSHTEAKKPYAVATRPSGTPPVTFDPNNWEVEKSSNGDFTIVYPQPRPS